MTDLDTRLHALRADPAFTRTPPAPSPAQLRERAQRRHRRRTRRVALAAVLPVMAIVVAVVVLREPNERSTDVTVGPPTSVEALTAQRSLGNVSGVTLSVSPNRDLHDGDLVQVTVQGLEQLPNAAIVMCSGDVIDQTAMTACDFSSVTDPDASQPGQVYAATQKVVSIPRFIDITARSSDPNVAEPYDCATEPAGCVLAVGPIAMPVRGVAVPLAFVADPVATPSATAEPSVGLVDGQTVEILAEGLRPNGSFAIGQCAPDGSCEYDVTGATSDSRGRLQQRVAAWSAVYTDSGEHDCTTERCIVSLTENGGAALVEVPLDFAAGVRPPEPSLRIEPAGPYVDQQEVTVRGTGFRPGMEVGGEIGQCPNDKDTSKEERCSYSDISSHVVDEQGAFNMNVKLQAALLFTGSCTEGAGCHLGWVIPHGPTIAKAPLTFR